MCHLPEGSFVRKEKNKNCKKKCLRTAKKWYKKLWCVIKLMKVYMRLRFLLELLENKSSQKFYKEIRL